MNISVLGLDHPKTRWKIPLKIVENNKAKNLWDLIWTNKQVLANQPGILVIDKNQKSALVINITISSDGNVRKNE